jgi:hypothetical protein
MTFEFGETEESNAFFDRNPSFVPFFEKLMTAANKCFGRRATFKNHLEDVIFSQGHTCRDDFTELVFLAVNGYANGAAKILRGLYERAVTLAYIGDSNEKARRFHRYSGIQAHRSMEAALKLFTEEEFEKVAGAGSIGWINRYLDREYVRRLADTTLRTYPYNLLHFVRWWESIHHTGDIVEADLTESTLLDYLRFQSSQQPRPSASLINDRVAVTDRALRNQFPNAPCQIALGFHSSSFLAAWPHGPIAPTAGNQPATSEGT